MDEISQQQIKDYILSNTDFGFEMKVAKIFDSLDWAVRHSGTYKDPILQKNREFDLRVSKTLKKWGVTFKMSVECKNLKPSYPLIVQVVNRSSSEAFNEIVHYSENGFQPSVSRIKINSRYRAGHGEWVGKSFDQIGTDRKGNLISNEGKTFDKMSQALNSAAGLLQECLPSDNASCRPRYFVLPMLIIPDNCLWRVKYDESGEMVGEPEKVESLQYYVAQSWPFTINAVSNECTLSHLEIVTISHLRKFLSTLTAEDNVISMSVFKVE